MDFTFLLFDSIPHLESKKKYWKTEYPSYLRLRNVSRYEFFLKKKWYNLLLEKLERNLLDPRANKFHGKLRKVKKGGRSTNRPRPVRFFFFSQWRETMGERKKKKGGGEKSGEKWIRENGRRINLRRVFLNFSSSLFRGARIGEPVGRSICQNFRVIPRFIRFNF